MSSGRPRPAPRLIRTATDAEEVAADWMRYWGFTDAVRTPTGADGGVDVASAIAVAQVKAHHRPVGRPDVQKLHGVAAHDRKRALFFSLDAYTAEAAEWGTAAGVALFRFDLQGEPTAVNDQAHLISLGRTDPAEGVESGGEIPTYPTCCTDHQAVQVLLGQRGRFTNREELTAVRQSWVRLEKMRIDYTITEGRKAVLRQHSRQVIYESLTGQPFAVRMPKQAPQMRAMPAHTAHIRGDYGGSDVAKFIVDAWRRLGTLRQPAAGQRQLALVERLGVPGASRSVRVGSEGSLLFPVYVGLLQQKTARRLVVVDGLCGSFHQELSRIMTTNYHAVAPSLNSPGLRPVPVPP